MQENLIFVIMCGSPANF